MNPLRVLLLGKAGDPLCANAADYMRQHGARTDVFLGRRGEAFPTVGAAGFDYLISYLSPWVVPAALLERASVAAINFHPGPPEYPGIGCTNFALYEGATSYGVTCHHLAANVDTGPLIQVIRFPVYATDTVLSLTQRCYASIAVLYYEMVDRMLAGQPLPVSNERWTRRPFRRTELNALCRLTSGMTQDEIQRRIRATTFPGYPSAAFDDADAMLSQAPQQPGEV